MKKQLLTLVVTLAFFAGHSQDDVYPAKAFAGLTFITNGTVHIGNGQVLERATIMIQHGKIVRVGADLPIPQDMVRVIDAKGQQVYPGLILPVTDIGIKEVAGGVPGNDDYRELGDYNPDVRSIVAYSTDSRVINPIRSNGILLAGIAPAGGIISGSSTVVQLDAWNWEDATYKADNGMHVNLPAFLSRPPAAGATGGPDKTNADALEKIESLKSFFRQAKAYLAEAHPVKTNLKFEATRKLFDHTQKLFVHADQVKQMLIAIDFAKEFHFDVVIVGGDDSYLIPGLLKENNIAVILAHPHRLPDYEDDDALQRAKTPAVLQQAGVLFALNDVDEESRYRNLMFNAGTTVAYGLSKEQALQSITLNAAMILGIDSLTGSIEAGKDANIVISSGDLLDMRTSIITRCLIQGRDINLTNKQTQLYDRYMTKYGLK